MNPFDENPFNLVENDTPKSKSKSKKKESEMPVGISDIFRWSELSPRERQRIKMMAVSHALILVAFVLMVSLILSNAPEPSARLFTR